MKRVFAILIGMIMLCASVFAQEREAEENEMRSFPFPNHRSIQLKVPKSWRSNLLQLRNDAGPIIQFTSQSDSSFRVLLIPAWAMRPDTVLPGTAGLKKQIEEAVEEMKPRSVETELPIKELTGPSVVGYYFSFTERAPKPDEYKHVTRGLLRLGELLITFLVLTKDGAENASGETIACLETATYTENQASSPDSDASLVKIDAIQIIQRENDYLLTVPVSRLSMSIPRNGLSQRNSPVGGSTDHLRYFYFAGLMDHHAVIISGWFEPEQEFAGVKKFWDDEIKGWKKSGLPKPRDVSFTRIGNWDAIVYDLKPPIPGASRFSNTHIRAHWLQAGTWIDIHLSFTSGLPSQEARAKLDSLLRNIVVTEKDSG